MERKIRRIDRAISERESRGILHKGEYGILSTVSREGQPYGVPLSFSYTGEVIYFHCALEGRKVDHLEQDNRVSFCVVGRTEVLPAQFGTKYESVIVSGRVAEVTGAEKQAGLLELLKKYSPAFLKEGRQYMEDVGEKVKVYKIVIESITGKSRK